LLLLFSFFSAFFPSLTLDAYPPSPFLPFPSTSTTTTSKAMPLVLPDGLDSLEELLTFLRHPVPDVRAMAAHIALSISASEVRIGGPREDGREGGRMEREEED